MVMSGNRFLLDTSVFIDYFRGSPIARKIIFDMRSPNVTAGYSIITEAELWAGVIKFRTPEQHILLLKPFTRYFVNVTIARRAGELLAAIRTAAVAKDRLPGLDDCIIAATAEYYHLIIYTRNKNHFQYFDNYSIGVQFYSQ